MRDFLLSVGYDRWILPALLVIPLIGALLARGERPEVVLAEKRVRRVGELLLVEASRVPVAPPVLEW